MHSYYFWIGFVMLAGTQVASLIIQAHKADASSSSIWGTILAFFYFVLAWWFIIA
jgi:hypothetical protein